MEGSSTQFARGHAKAIGIVLTEHGFIPGYRHEPL